MNPLFRRDLVRIFFRSFLIQGLWTVQRAQNLGYVFSLWPVFRRLYPKREDRSRATRAHAGYFSTHPYTAGILMGVVAGMEEDLAHGRGGTREAVLAARSAMSGPLAALGETFFWGTWLPFCLMVAFLWWHLWSSMAGWAPVVYLGLFNVPHLWVRSGGLWLGYRWKTEVVPHLVVFRIQSILPLLAVAGLGLVLWGGGLVTPKGGSPLRGFLWMGFFWGALRLGVRPSSVAVGVAVVSVAYSWVRALS